MVPVPVLEVQAGTLVTVVARRDISGGTAPLLHPVATLADLLTTPCIAHSRRFRDSATVAAAVVVGEERQDQPVIAAVTIVESRVTLFILFIYLFHV